MEKLTQIVTSIISFINGAAVPLVFALAFIVFLFGVFRYFILGGADQEKRKEGRQMMVYSIVGFAVMIVVWGLVNLVVSIIGISDNSMPPLPTFGTTTTSGTIQTSPASTANSGNAGGVQSSPANPSAPQENYYGITTPGGSPIY